jgi:hypothetical protein
MDTDQKHLSAFIRAMRGERFGSERPIPIRFDRSLAFANGRNLTAAAPANRLRRYFWNPVNRGHLFGLLKTWQRLAAADTYSGGV